MKFLILTAALLASASTAFAANYGEGYNRHLRSHAYSHGEWIYLNSLSEYQGRGRLTDCERVSTYQGGPKNGMWRTYYVCRVGN